MRASTIRKATFAEVLELGSAAAEELAEELLGVPLRKALDPLHPDGFVTIEQRLSKALARATHATEADVIERALATLDVDWKGMSSEAVDRVVDAANTALGKAAHRVIPKLDVLLEVEGVRTGKGTRASAIKRYDLDIVGNFSQRDLDAEKAVRTSSLNFVRDNYGRRAGELSAKAREVVARGMAEGIGNDVIAMDLRDAFGKQITKGLPYWNVVSNAFVGKARTTSMLNSFEDAAIDAYIVEAVIDEVTTDICRFYHGQTFSVASGKKQMEKLLELTDPEDVKYENPWIRVGKNEEGQRELFVKNRDGSRTTVAEVVRSGVGKKDDQGEFKNGKSPEQLTKLGCPWPPLHGRCRTCLLPA